MKTARQKLILANDKLFRKIILLRDNFTCQWSGKKTNLQVAHFFSRSNLRLRWEFDNACVLNAGIHLYKAHKEAEKFRDFWIDRIGKRKFDMLKLKKRFYSPVRMNDLKAWNIYLKVVYEQLVKQSK